MKKKKQNNIGEFDLFNDKYNLEAEIEPGYRLFFPWLHREYWQEQEDEARTKQEEIRLNNGRTTEK